MKRPAIAARILTALCLALAILGAAQFTSDAFSLRVVASAERPTAQVFSGSVTSASLLVLPVTGVTYETVHNIPTAPCSPTPRFAGFEYDLLDRPVVGWSESSACGGGSAYRWSRFESGAWTQNTITQPGCCGGIRGEADLVLSPSGTPFFAYTVPDAFIFGQEWHRAHVVDLGINPTGHGVGTQPIGSYRDCVASFPKLAMDFAPGAESPSLAIGTHCSFSGWLALNSASVHGNVPFRTPAGTEGEFHSVDYATAPNGSHHLTYYSERGGPNWGAYYSNGSPGHEVLLVQPHRNRRAETSVAVGPDGRIHVAIGGAPLCGNTFEGGLLYLTSLDGVNWTRTFVDSASGRNPSIVLDTQGQPRIAYWRYNNEVRFASLDAGAWNTTPVYTTTTPAESTSVKLAYDNSGQPHVLFFNPDAGNITISSGIHSNLAPSATTPGDQTSAAGDTEALQILASDNESDALSYSACNLPPGLSIDPGTGLVTGTITPGTPPSTYLVTITATDVVGNTSSVGFNWTIAVNHAPSAANDSATAPEDTEVNISVLTNDTDPDADNLTVANITQGAHGSVSTNPDGTVTYTPNSNFFGPDTFTYTVGDGDGVFSTANVSITVTPVNDAPTASDGAALVNEDEQVEITLAGADIDSMGLNFAVIDGSLNGSLSAVVGNKVIYTPNADFHGTDAFTIRANDGELDSNLACVTINVAPMADAPILATVGNLTVAEGVLLTLQLSAFDPDGDVLTFTASGLPDGANLDPASGAFSWTPTFDQAGTYTVVFTVADPGGLNHSQTSTINVTDVGSNSGPVCSAAYSSISEIWPPNHKRTDVIEIFGLSDPDNDPLSVRVLRILQDEPTSTLGDGTTWIDGGGLGEPKAWVRAERSGTAKIPGNGRVYEIFFEASDGRGKTCTGTVKVGVPHDQGKGPAIDDGKRYDSTVAAGPCLNCSN